MHRGEFWFILLVSREAGAISMNARVAIFYEENR